MPHHYRKDVTEAYEWCKTCNKLTLHAVFDRRLAHCKEHEHPGLVDGMTKAQRKKRDEQEKDKKNPRLF